MMQKSYSKHPGRPGKRGGSLPRNSPVAQIEEEYRGQKIKAEIIRGTIGEGSGRPEIAYWHKNSDGSEGEFRYSEEAARANWENSELPKIKHRIDLDLDEGDAAARENDMEYSPQSEDEDYEPDYFDAEDVDVARVKDRLKAAGYDTVGRSDLSFRTDAPAHVLNAALGDDAPHWETKPSKGLYGWPSLRTIVTRKDTLKKQVERALKGTSAGAKKGWLKRKRELQTNVDGYGTGKVVSHIRQREDGKWEHKSELIHAPGNARSDFNINEGGVADTEQEAHRQADRGMQNIIWRLKHEIRKPSR